MLRRRELMACKDVLPSGYKRCNWLGSTGTQWIDSGIQPEFGDSFRFRSQRMGINAPILYAGNTNEIAITASEYGYNRRVVYTKYFQGPTDAVAFNHNAYLMDGIFHDFIFDADGLVLDGVKVCGISSNRKNPDTSVRLFRMSSMYGYTRISAFEIDRMGALLLSLIPAIDTSGIPCMYDTVSKQTFYNKGTGEFLYELA